MLSYLVYTISRRVSIEKTDFSPGREKDFKTRRAFVIGCREAEGMEGIGLYANRGMYVI